MNAWRWFGGFLFVVILSLGVSAHGQGTKDKDKDKDKAQVGKDKDKDKDKEKPKSSGVTLAWKAFDGKEPFYQELMTHTKQNMKVMQMEVKQEQSQTFWVQWTPEKKDGDNYVVKQKIIGVKMDIEIGGNKISYDSTSKEPPPANPLTDFFKNLKDAEFTLKINSKTLAVTEITGQKEFIANLAKTNPQLLPLLQAILSEKALKQMADPIFSAIPEGGMVPAPKDAKDPKSKSEWTKKNTLDMGPIGTYTTNYTYTFEKTVDSKDQGKLAEIGVTTTLEYAPPAAKAPAEGLPFRIAGGKLASTKGTGNVVFNMDKGRIQSSEMNLELGGTLTIDIAGMTTDVELRQTQKSTLKTSDKNPLAK